MSTRKLKEDSSVHLIKKKGAVELVPETPLDNRIIVLEDKPANKTASGIHLPEASQEKPFTGTVVAVGPEVTGLKVEDKVRYPTRAGEKITINQQEYLIMRETDIYTILNK